MYTYGHLYVRWLRCMKMRIDECSIKLNTHIGNHRISRYLRKNSTKSGSGEWQSNSQGQIEWYLPSNIGCKHYAHLVSFRDVDLTYKTICTDNGWFLGRWGAILHTKYYRTWNKGENVVFIECNQMLIIIAHLWRLGSLASLPLVFKKFIHGAGSCGNNYEEDMEPFFL